MNRRPMRYAHAEGHTEVLYTGSGNELVTCGTDGDVRIWDDLEDDDPRSVCVGEWALALAMRDGKLYVSTDNHAIQRYTFPAFDKDGIVTRFTAPITQISFSKKNSKLACCSENMEAKLCSLGEDKTTSPLLVHEGPVLGMAICPIGKFGMTSSGDGFYRIWDLEENSIIKQMNCIPEANSFYSAKVLGRASFEPITGKFLAYPNNKELIILDNKQWQQKYTLTHPQIKSAITLCAFSPCGNYIAASTVTGQIVIWNINNLNAVGITDHPTSHGVCSMAWNPSENGELAFCDITGQLGTIVNCLGKQSKKKNDAAEEDLDLIEVIEREMDDGENETNEDQVNDSDEDNENAISLNKLKNETLRALPDEMDENSNSKRRSRSRSRSPVEKRVTAQPPFQPSATPLTLEHRYMCWNEVGIVRCHTTDSDSSIEVEFHDSSTHHSIHLNNHLNHILASLSSTVLVLACEAPSKLVCIALFGGSKEWSVSMPDLEEVVCVTATDNLVAAATTYRYLRLYTPLGTQLHTLCLSGQIVSLTGQKGLLHIVYHMTDPGIQDQQMAINTVQVQGDKVRTITEGMRLPLSPGALLRWVGCSDRGSVVTVDSAGVLRLYRKSDRLWLPLCESQNHTKGVSDTFYVISVSEETECVRLVLCRGAPFPPTAPRPTVMQLPLRLPFCEIETEKSQLEEELRRSASIGSQAESSARIEIALKLFALACRSEIEQRALELIEVIAERRAVAPAARYASRLGKMHLSDKLSELAQQWESRETLQEVTAEENEDSEEINDTQDADTSIIISSHKSRETIVPLKPAPMPKLLSQGNRNPFRKTIESAESNGSERASPLSLTDRTLVINQNTAVTSPSQHVLKNLPSETFVQWYRRNKENLEAENTDLTPEELTKLAMKTYKSLQKSNTIETTPKRKLSPSPDNGKSKDDGKVAPKQSKLSAFSFQKRS